MVELLSQSLREDAEYAFMRSVVQHYEDRVYLRRCPRTSVEATSTFVLVPKFGEHFPVLRNCDALLVNDQANRGAGIQPAYSTTCPAQHGGGITPQRRFVTRDGITLPALVWKPLRNIFTYRPDRLLVGALAACS